MIFDSISYSCGQHQLQAFRSPLGSTNRATLFQIRVVLYWVTPQYFMSVARREAALFILGFIIALDLRAAL